MSFGKISAQARISKILGKPIQSLQTPVMGPGLKAASMKLSVATKSPNVTILRKYDPKNYKQLLFGFLTKCVGSSYELETFEEKNKHHARLTGVPTRTKI
ncbi:hypothetical protein DAPPUDRAFT_267680 [Daphnia pulex]|uniref:Uncharacterized protein n=1 Tax=Daphnia pulex TaxID=6669 RepID=E9HWU0_DAPPU|nr:hypothetical protein DAPPUDRAFT_267680 [Daphnia pulex]|eukprot:EFX63787.1 hypothetical protein DAPPUDRAFT_267680 [Daphnia pulex]